MINQHEILSYVNECSHRFKIEFSNEFEKLEIEKGDIHNYTKLLNNITHSLMVKYSPKGDSFLSKYENHDMAFSAIASFVSMDVDYNIICSKVISEHLKI